jgi:hypothetical protein
MAKIGRNEPCSCGSGIKYKRCHGSPRVIANAGLNEHLSRAEALSIQRQRQQGLGKPIISGELNGHRFVAVKNRLMRSKRWRTFHDFLVDYIKAALGHSWGTSELSKPIDQRHPILIWYQKFCEHQKLCESRNAATAQGKVLSATMTGAAAAYLHLAYDLYALDHNAELQNKLVSRLRNHDNFSGARYEVFVAAAFIRAGFDITLENEGDRSVTHCEFTATYRETGKRFSVEAKRRQGSKPRIGRLFNNALSKRADHDRVIFIDVNMPDEIRDQECPPYFHNALRSIRSFEGKPLNGEPPPAAYVFVTNTPWELCLDAPPPRFPFVAEGFQVSGFKGDTVFPSLRHLINAREAHIEMHRLFQSLEDHLEIPSTFDGEMPAYAFNSQRKQILIGQRYWVKDTDGVEKPAEVTAASVCEQEKIAHLGMKFEDGRAAIYSAPLDDEELEAWKRHPDTFFGVVGQRKFTANTPLEFYDFLLECYSRNSKEQLLKLMAANEDFERLILFDQRQLASIYAERMTIAAFRSI